MINLKKSMKSKHRGFGGMILMLTAIISGLTMIYAVILAWNSNAVAMSDNIAYITTVNTANQLYIGRVDSFEYKGTKTVMTTKNGYRIDPNGQYSSMLKSAKLISPGAPYPQSYDIKWDKNKGECEIQFGSFKTTVGSEVRPHKQAAVIEST